MRRRMVSSAHCTSHIRASVCSSSAPLPLLRVLLLRALMAAGAAASGWLLGWGQVPRCEVINDSTASLACELPLRGWEAGRTGVKQGQRQVRRPALLSATVSAETTGLIPNHCNLPAGAGRHNIHCCWCGSLAAISTAGAAAGQQRINYSHAARQQCIHFNSGTALRSCAAYCCPDLAVLEWWRHRLAAQPALVGAPGQEGQGSEHTCKGQNMGVTVYLVAINCSHIAAQQCKPHLFLLPLRLQLRL